MKYHFKGILIVVFTLLLQKAQSQKKVEKVNGLEFLVKQEQKIVNAIDEPTYMLNVKIKNKKVVKAEIVEIKDTCKITNNEKVLKTRKESGLKTKCFKGNVNVDC